MNRYQIFYQGRLAESHITRLGAVKHVRELVEKGWDIKYLQVIDSLQGAN